MDDALFVRGFQRFRDLLCDGQRLVERESGGSAFGGTRPTGDEVGERRSLDQFHHERAHAGGLFQAVDVRNVRVIQRGEHLRFAAEPREPIGIVRDGGQQDLDRDVAIQLGVSCAR